MRAIRKLSFKFSSLKKALLVDVDPLDILINDVPEQCLDKDVTPKLGPKYLSICEQSDQEIISQTVYRGHIMGRSRRLFVSIPTKHPGVKNFRYVHYLIDTGSPVTTLTRRALCAIHGVDQRKNPEFLLNENYLIGCRKLDVKCSNPDQASKSRPFHNINLLGMDFFQRFDQAILNQNFNLNKFVLEVTFKGQAQWDKKIL